MTSTFVERLFKDLTAWTSKPGQLVATIGAKHMNASFHKSVVRWRGEAEEGVIAAGLDGIKYIDVSIQWVICVRVRYIGNTD